MASNGKERVLSINLEANDGQMEKLKYRQPLKQSQTFTMCNNKFVRRNINLKVTAAREGIWVKCSC